MKFLSSKFLLRLLFVLPKLNPSNLNPSRRLIRRELVSWKWTKRINPERAFFARPMFDGFVAFGNYEVRFALSHLYPFNFSPCQLFPARDLVFLMVYTKRLVDAEDAIPPLIEKATGVVDTQFLPSKRMSNPGFDGWFFTFHTLNLRPRWSPQHLLNDSPPNFLKSLSLRATGTTLSLWKFEGPLWCQMRAR